MFDKIQGSQSKEQERKHFHALLDEIDKLEMELSPTFPTPAVQPVHDALQVIVKVRSAVPAFKSYVARIHSGVGKNVNVTFREATKNPDRMLQKGILKMKLEAKDVGSDIDVDCCKILDVYGCLIECPSCEDMEVIVRNMRSLSKDPETKGNICRSNNRWGKGTPGGWRDYMTNVSIDGAIFEIQIVHKKMMVARKDLDGHTSYEKYRLQIEMLEHVQPKRKEDEYAVDAYDVAFSAAEDAREQLLPQESKCFSANGLQQLLPQEFKCFSADDIDTSSLGFNQAQWFRANQNAAATVFILTER